MDPRRLRYLREMGVTVWERRETGAAASAVDAGQCVVPGPSAPIEPAPAAESAPARVAAPSVRVPEPVARDLPLPPSPVAAAAGSEAIAALDWPGLRAAIGPCTRCPELAANRTQTVFGVGNTEAEWMVIGEAPGADEDRQGEPFVGKAGQLLNAMLLAIGLPRETVFIANILKCRPPNNRDPKPEEVANCIPYLRRQIELVRPRVILCVGRIAAQNLLGTDRPIGRLRGQRLTEPATGTPMVITYHPAYLLRTPSEKRKAWEDLKLARAMFAELPAS